MKYLLDSNICIHFFRGKEEVFHRINDCKSTDFAISEITYLELLYGAECSSNPSKNKNIVLDFVSKIQVLPISEILELFAKEKFKLRKLGTPISDFDLLIASTSVKYKLIMVTENTSEFQRVSKIKLENWVSR